MHLKRDDRVEKNGCGTQGPWPDVPTIVVGGPRSIRAGRSNNPSHEYVVRVRKLKNRCKEEEPTDRETRSRRKARQSVLIAHDSPRENPGRLRAEQFYTSIVQMLPPPCV